MFIYPPQMLCQLIISKQLNYHRWGICADACTKGKEDDVKVYQFAKSALVRKFGDDWYSNLEVAVKEYLNR